eukprot:SM016162S02503  [mRNA]  locus=s16162:78:167:- [translate_table: standard]
MLTAWMCSRYVFFTESLRAPRTRAGAECS